MDNLMTNFRRARAAGAPIVAIETPDPAATIGALLALQKGSSEPAPMISWDAGRGWVGLNDEGDTAISKLCGNSDVDSVTRSPAEMLQFYAPATPPRAVLVMHNAQRLFDSSDTLGVLSVVQAMWNLRDPYKNSERTLVLLSPTFSLPPELQQDTLILDEPLPGDVELEQIVLQTYANVGVETPGPETVRRQVDALRGLASFPAEQVAAMSIRRAGLDLDALWERKRKMIEATPGLSVWRDGDRFAGIGGCENVKYFMNRVIAGRAAPRCIVFVDEIEKMLGGAGGDTSGVSQGFLGTLLTYMQDKEASGSIFIGPPGCLSGETPMLYRRGRRNSGRVIKLSDLHKKFNGVKLEGGRGKCKPWSGDAPTFLHSYDFSTGKVFYNQIKNVWATGGKPCVRLRLSSGENLTLTKDHPVLTPDGFVEAGELTSGSVVVTRGSMKPSKNDTRAPRKERMTVRGLKYYRSGMKEEIIEGGKVYKYKRQTRARLVIEAQLNSLSYEIYLQLLKTEPRAVDLIYLPDNLEVHHKNENALDDRLENLEILTKAEHTLEHNPLARFNVEYTSEAVVIQILDAGEVETYDIQMTAPCENFATAGGAIVHNCAKTQVAKAVGNEAGVPTIALDLNGMKGSLVGESEARLRTALKVISAVGTDRALFIATCNSIGSLPPELRRRFTLGTFFFDLPTEEERAGIWDIYLKKYATTGERSEVQDEGWTGAEIKQCAKLSYDLGLTLAEASQFIVPVAKSAADQVRLLRSQADRKFLSASYPGVYQNNDRAVTAPASAARKQILED